MHLLEYGITLIDIIYAFDTFCPVRSTGILPAARRSPSVNLRKLMIWESACSGKTRCRSWRISTRRCPKTFGGI